MKGASELSKEDFESSLPSLTRFTIDKVIKNRHIYKFDVVKSIIYFILKSDEENFNQTLNSMKLMHCLTDEYIYFLLLIKYPEKDVDFWTNNKFEKSKKLKNIIKVMK